VANDGLADRGEGMLLAPDGVDGVDGELLLEALAHG
jgi:hypothetical protein